MEKIVCLALAFVTVTGNAAESNFPDADPAYLDWLRAEGRYEEFSKLMSIPNPKFVKEKTSGGKAELSRREAMFDEELEEGDIMPSTNEPEEGRQGIIFEKFPKNKWPNRKMPYVIASDFNTNQRRQIQDAIIYWNIRNNCVKLINRTNEKDYVYIFSGSGCWAYLGRKGGKQGLSLQKNGCLHRGIILHELQHAVGFAHEHNRQDRDDYIEIQWQNLKNDSPWEDTRFKKQDPKYFNVLPTYDYYSILHAPVHLSNGKRAFKVKRKGIDEGRIGKGNDLTEIDVRKTGYQYCS